MRRTNAAQVFFYRYRASDGALREIKLGERAAAAVTRRELQDEVIRPTLNRAPRCGTYLLGRIRCAYTHAAVQGRLPDPNTLHMKK